MPSSLRRLLTTLNHSRSRLAVRMVAGLLVVSLPITVVLAFVLTSKASNSLTSAGANSGAQLANAVTLHIEDFVSERQENLAGIAELATARLDDPRCGIAHARG